MNIKRIGIIVAAAALCLLLAACGGKSGTTDGGKAEPSGTEQTAAEPEAAPAAKSESFEDGGIPLTAYTDEDFGYTMLSPDKDIVYIKGNRDSNCSLWGVYNEEDDELCLFGFTEYKEDSPYFPEPADSASEPGQILDLFKEQIRSVILDTEALYMSDFDGSAFSYKELSVNGLAAVSFEDTLFGGDEDGDRDYGFTGVCVLGNCRPYVFWALDLTGDMSMTDTAQDTLLACLKDFAEGS